MPGIFKHNSVNWEDLFDPDVIGDGPQAHNFTEGGVPMQFAHVQYGTKRPDIGFTVRIGGADVDVTTLWAAKGTAAYVVAPNFSSLNVIASGISTASGSAQIIVRANGEFDGREVKTPGGTASKDSSWRPNLQGGIGSDYDVVFTIVGSTATATITNGAPTRTQISVDRSINVSLTVTSQTVLILDFVVNVKIYQRSSGALRLDHNVAVHMEVGNDA